MLQFKGLHLATDFYNKYNKKFEEAQECIDNETIKNLENYTPIAMKRFKNRGKMSKSHKSESPGVIINTEPKARREYYTNKGLSDPERGKFWLERMKADHKNEILRKAKEKFT